MSGPACIIEATTLTGSIVIEAQIINKKTVQCNWALEIQIVTEASRCTLSFAVPACKFLVVDISAWSMDVQMLGNYISPLLAP